MQLPSRCEVCGRPLGREPRTLWAPHPGRREVLPGKPLVATCPGECTERLRERLEGEYRGRR